MSLVAWSLICRPHKQRGLGIHHLDFVQRACLTKHLAKCFDGFNSLWTRLVRFKYKVPSSVWDLKKSCFQSWAWHAISSTTEILKFRSRWFVKNS